MVRPENQNRQNGHSRKDGIPVPCGKTLFDIKGWARKMGKEQTQVDNVDNGFRLVNLILMH